MNLYHLIFDLVNTMIRCGVKTCYNPKERFGVCGRHKTYAYQPSFPIKSLESLVDKYLIESSQLEKEGIDVLKIQSYYQSLTNRTNNFPPRLERFGNLLESIQKESLRLQQEYDPYLISNYLTRLLHANRRCECFICSLE